MHGHSHGHDHATTRSSGIRRKLIISTIITVLFVFIELAAGLVANSLALIGDALHNITDALALVLSLLAVMLERRPATAEKSFGYQRAGILAAFVNAAALVAFTLFIFKEAWERFRHPESVDSAWMIGTSLVAITVNLGITLWLRREGRGDVNIRSAVIHQLGDAMSSAGVIIAAVLIALTGDSFYDPLLSVLIGVVIIWSSWGILRETINLLLEGTPQGIDPEEVARALAAQDGVFGVHHLHIWALGPSRSALSCHLLLGDVTLKSTREIIHRVNEMLARSYGIVHTTIQLEDAGCPEDDPWCVIPELRPNTQSEE